ncbi:MAG: hypothetical protein HKN18_07430 [Silicimonas sp.]|nr:hypothetical protein [Silicimonas sp.]
MARRSKSSKSSENEEKSEENASESETPDAAASESTPDEPVLIEAEAVEVEVNAEAPEANPEETSAAVVPTEAAPSDRRPGFVPLVLGGLVAGGIGFAAGLLAPWVFVDSDADDALRTSISENGERLDALSSEISEVQGALPPPVDLSGIESTLSQIERRISDSDARISALDSEISNLSDLKEQLASFNERLTTLEIDEGNSSSAQAALAEQQLEAFRQDLAKMISEAEARVAEARAKASETELAAAAAAETAERQADLAELRAAIDSGTPFVETLAKFDGAPDALSNVASDGVPTLVSLQRSFPDVAREALATAQRIPDDASAGERLSAFLKRQTNARSLEPRQGSDADAVLSRAEASLSEGKLDQALDELSTLPDNAQSSMSAWLSKAETRATALRAVEDLTANMN